MTLDAKILKDLRDRRRKIFEAAVRTRPAPVTNKGR